MHPDVEEILDNARRRASEAKREVGTADAREFVEAVERKRDEGMNPVIAEVKPTSPTTDGVNTDDPVEIARSMVEGGAVALSVLTEPYHFDGSLETLRRVRDAVDVPVLRKDFVLDTDQIHEVESDLLLLIVEFLDDDLDGMVTESLEAGFEPLVEVHTSEQLETALGTDARVIGVNNRDLKRLEVDLSVSENLLPQVPDDRLAVAESGISSPDDARRMFDAGADAILVGSSIMQGGDVETKTRELVEA